MKPNRNSNQWVQSLLAGIGLASSISLGLAVPDRVLHTFDANVSGWGTAWGNATAVFDPAQDNTGNGGGSCYISGDFAADQNTLTVYGVVEGDPWWHPTGQSFNMSEYQSVEFDIKWDNSKTLPIPGFNTPSGGGESGITIWNVDYPGFSSRPTIGTVTVPTAASNGWVHVSLPINPATPNLDPSKGIVFKKWITAATRDAGGTYGFWVDNVILKGTDAPPPPPTMALQPAVPGLQLMTTTAGGQYTRYNIRTVNPDSSWVNSPTSTTYSVTIKDYPRAPYNFFQTHILLVPAGSAPYGPGDSAVDWNATNLIFVVIQNTPGGSGFARFMWKTNVAGGGWQGQVWERTNPPIPELTSATILGTWSLTFNHNTNVTLIGPDNTTTNFILPAEAIPWFTDPAGMYAYVGVQPNSTANIGQAAVISRVRITGAVDGGGSPTTDIDDQFLVAPLDPSTWATAAGDPSGVRVLPAGMPFWLSWTLPDSGFSPIWSPVLGPGATWTDPGLGTPVNLGYKKVPVPASLSPSNAFFRLIKREYTRLQVLMPGETAAPGTPTGKTGTPTPQTAFVPFNITVNAVDANWYPVGGVNNVVALTSTDPFAFLPSNAPLVNGTRTFEVVFGSEGTWTITATDVTDPSKTPDTGSPTTVNP